MLSAGDKDADGDDDDDYDEDALVKGHSGEPREQSGASVSGGPLIR